MSEHEPPGGPIRGPESWFSGDDEAPGDDLMPHWTEPGVGGGASRDAGSPRWRDGANDYNELDDIRLLDPTPSETPDPTQQASEVFFGLEDDDVGLAPAPVAVGSPPASTAPPQTNAPVAPQGRVGARQAGPAPRAEAPEAPPAKSGDRDMVSATLVGLALAVLAVGALYLGEVPGLLVASAILGMASIEFYNAMRKVGYNPASLVGLVTTVGLTLAVYWKGVIAYPVVLFLAVVFSLLWFMVPVSNDRPVPNLGITMLGIGYVGVLGSFAGLLLSSDSIVFDANGNGVLQSNGAGLLFAAILATVAYDVGAYLVGRSMGRTPLSSHSPNKTLEGLIGGLVVCIVVTVIVIGVIGIAPWGKNPGGFPDSIILGVVAAVAATLGDLAESMIKRDIGVKDMGTMLPGHGGILDRFDGLLFVMPAIWCTGLAIDILEGVSAVSA